MNQNKMIRQANKFDIPQIISMLWNYHDHGGIKDLTVSNEETAKKILTIIVIGGGLALVSEKDGKLNGMLLAVKTPYLWDHSRFVMNEIAYWVEPEFRKGRIGYSLLKEYIQICDKMKEDKQICNYTISQMEGQDIDYSRFGFRPIEHTWSI